MAEKRNFKRRNNSAKPRKMDETKEKRFKKEDDRCNDPAWYVREGQLAKDVASLSFNTALGAKTFIDEDNQFGSWSTVSVPYGVPGIISLNYIPSVGVSTNGASPINIAAKNLYSYVRHANSGGKNYDSPDLMLYLLSMDSIYMIIQHLQRAYGAARVYSQLNRYVGDAFLRAMGFDANDVRSNLAQFRAMINMLIVKASTLCVPNTMSYFLRHAWMARSIFQDAPIDKSQVYLYRPVAAYKYIETQGVGHCDLAPCAVTVATGGTGEFWNPDVIWTIAAWFQYANDLLAALVNSEDIGIMSGDIRKAFGEENQFRLALVPEDYVLEVNYSEEVLDQVHNTIFTSLSPRTILDPTDNDQWSKINLAGFTVGQDPLIGDGALLCKPQFLRCRQVGLKHVLDMIDKEPTPERVLVATRNMVCGDVYNGQSNYTFSTLTDCGSDICLGGIMWDHRVDPNDNTKWILRPRFIGQPDGSEMQITSNDVGDYSAFHKAPLLYGFNDVYNGAFSNTIGEIDNYTIIDRSTLSKIHESAILSMFGVPV